MSTCVLFTGRKRDIDEEACALRMRCKVREVVEFDTVEDDEKAKLSKSQILVKMEEGKTKWGNK